MKVFQVLDALDYGDGVSNSVINTHKLLNEMNIENSIYSKWAHESVDKYRRNIEQLHPDKNTIVLYHFSGYSHIMADVCNLKCKVALVYHNVTPPDFFKDLNQDAYENCLKGLEQLKSNISRFNYFAGVSEFNKIDLMSYGAKDVEVIPVALNLDNLMHSVKVNTHVMDMYRGMKTFLAVGRIAPNKKVEDVLDIFEEYFSFVDANSVLLLVGDNEHSRGYFTELINKVRKLNCKENVKFLGKVADGDLYGYYKFANAFLCMSEHEGFCLPIIEAMLFDLPVIAYNSCAIPYVMGNAGVLVNKKEPRVLSEILDIVLKDDDLKDSILKAQKENIRSYMNDALKAKYNNLLSLWFAS